MHKIPGEDVLAIDKLSFLTAWSCNVGFFLTHLEFLWFLMLIETLMWSLHFSFPSTVTPIHLNLSTHSKFTLLMVYVKSSGDFLLETQIALHLLEFRGSCHVLDQFTILFISL